MTTANVTCRTAVTGNAAVGQVVPFAFPISASSDLEVIQRVTATGVETVLAETTNYVVTDTVGAIDPVADWSAGGNVTMVTAVAATAQIHVIRKTPNTQTLDLVAGASFSAESVEGALDRNTRNVIENTDALDRTLRFPDTDPVASIGDMPNSVDRASKWLYFGDDGVPTAAASVTPDTATVSAFMETVLDDADGDAAITTMGGMYVFNVKTYGATGDGVTDDTAAIRLAVAACSAGDILYFPSGYTFKITEGITIDTGIVVWGYGATLYMDGQSGRSLNIPTFSAAVDAMIMVWNGDAGQDIMTWSSGVPTIEAGAVINDFYCYGLTFKNSKGLASALGGNLSHMLDLVGVVGGAVKDCHFEDSDRSMLTGMTQNVVIANNSFEDGKQNGIAGHHINILITDNTFLDVEYTIESGTYQSTISNNVLRAENRCITGIWVPNGGNDQDVEVDVTGNIIDGYYTYKIFIDDSGADPTNFGRINVSDNVCIGRIYSSGAGILIDAADGDYVIANNQFDDVGTTANCGSFIQIEGTDTDGKYVIRGNTGHITTSYVYDLIQIPNIDILCTIADNTTIHDAGTSFRDSSSTGSLYRDAIRIGTFKSNLKILKNNYINQTHRYVDTSTDAIILLGGDTELYFSASAKDVTDIYANGFFVVHNLGAGTITLKDADAKIETTGNADISLTQYTSAGFIAVGTTGKVKQVF